MQGRQRLALGDGLLGLPGAVEGAVVGTDDGVEPRIDRLDPAQMDFNPSTGETCRERTSSASSVASL